MAVGRMGRRARARTQRRRPQYIPGGWDAHSADKTEARARARWGVCPAPTRGPHGVPVNDAFLQMVHAQTLVHLEGGSSEKG